VANNDLGDFIPHLLEMLPERCHLILHIHATLTP
jgi:hypothetical protein